jgi:hypothetical protein
MQTSSNRMNESFATIADLNLAKNILAYLQTPTKSYIGYVNFLLANHNKSTNLILSTTYDALVAKGKNLNVGDIAKQF